MLNASGCVNDNNCDRTNSFCDPLTCQCSQVVCPLKWTNGELVINHSRHKNDQGGGGLSIL